MHTDEIQERETLCCYMWRRGLPYLLRENNVGVYCSDVSGAFDRVSAARLLDKLSALGLHRDLFGTVQSWLRDRQAFVVVAGDRSAGSVLSKIVYQGTVWVPPYGTPLYAMLR